MHVFPVVAGNFWPNDYRQLALVDMAWISRRLAESAWAAAMTAIALTILVLVAIEAVWYSGFLD
jgi:hypothetical protein